MSNKGVDGRGFVGPIARGHDGKIVEDEGASVPADGTAGYAPGATFWLRGGAAGAAQYINEGSATSCAFKAIAAGANLAVSGIAAGYKIARGQAAAVTGSSTVATGLTTVVAAVANMDDDPVVDPEFATASIGDQAGSPAAGSIILKTWKTLGGTPVAGTVAKKVNWIAIGT